MGYREDITAGATGEIITVGMRSSSTGQLLGSITDGQVTAHYIRDGEDAVVISVSAGVLNTWSSGGWVATAKTGEYQLGVPDAAFAAGAKRGKITVTATGAIDLEWDYRIQSVNPHDAAAFGLSRLDAAVSSRLASASYTAPPSLAAINAEVDTALGDYDAPTRAEATADKDEIISRGDAAWVTATGFAVTGDAMTLTTGERDAVAAALLDLANAIESSITLRAALRIILASQAGKLSGVGTGTIRIRDVADGKDRIVGTVDGNGNRTATTVDGS